MTMRDSYRRFVAACGVVAMGLGLLAGSLQMANAEEPNGVQTRSSELQVAAQDIICTAGTVYAISDNGQLQQVTNGIVKPVGQPASDVNSFNGLGIGAGGKAIYAYERFSDGETMRLYRYNTDSGIWSGVPGLDDYDTSSSSHGGFSGTLVSGAVNLSDGNYLFGGFETVDNGRWVRPRYTQTFKLWQYDIAGNQIGYLGYIDTYTGNTEPGSANGDMAFDADGNLFIVRGTGSSTTVFSVTAANLAKANGGAIVSSGSNSFETTSDVNGVAFDASGKAYLGGDSAVESFDMPNWSNRSTVTSKLQSSTDLASCSSPATVTLEKVVNGRVLPSDQFKLSLYDGAQELGSATTAGSANGLQDERVGPMPTVRNHALTFKETKPDGTSTTDLGAYATNYECVVDGSTQISAGAGTEGSVTIPQTGRAVVCRFTNSPLVTHVKVSKTVLEPGGGGARPGAGWTLSSSTTATAGKVVQNPGRDQQADANGQAQWSVKFDSVSARATIHVAETQRQGYAFSTGQCVVTDGNGISGNSVPITSADGVDIPNVKPGGTVDCSFTNELQKASLTIVKSVIQRFGGSAAPDDFKLVATPDGGNAIPFKSGVTQDVDPGTYKVGETQLPGYEQDGEMSCAVDDKALAVSDAKVDVANGQHVTCTLTNKDKPGSLSWSKIDGAADAHSLSGSQWTITPSNDPDHPILITDNDGKSGYAGRDTNAEPGVFTVNDLHWGEYTLTESRAPAGYELDETAHAFTVRADHLDVSLGSIRNKQKTPPSLPFTGGMSIDDFRIGGVALMVLAVGCGWALRRRALVSPH